MKKEKWLIVGLVIISLLFWKDHSQLTKKIIELDNQISNLESEKDDCKNALDNANSSIEDARSAAWSSYEDMGDALDNLETF